ncbi:MAG: molybdopterin-dependent oxidoreductase [Calditerrivibrio sp.]|nr:molybdopterin-dependent oxidoreductase [Calditerrivibrio sp.]
MKNFVCSKDCIEACFASIDDNLTILPRNGPTFKGFVCQKLNKFLKKEIFTSDTSFVRQGGNLIYCELEKVLKDVSELMLKYRNENILYIRGSGSLGYAMEYWDLFFSHFPNVYFVEGSLCLSTGKSAHEEDFGIAINPPITNLDEVNNILLFGRDAYNVAPHLYSYLKELKRAGKKLVYIDPLKKKTLLLADRYIRIRPASDNYLALALLVCLGYERSDLSLAFMLEKCGVSQDDFEFLLEAIEDGKTGIITGYGLQRYSNGKNITQWINRLAYFTNNLNYLYYVKNSKEGLPKKIINNPKINISKILECLKQKFFKGAFVVAANPLVSYPSTGLLKEHFESLDFLVTVDTNITKTANFSTHFIKVGGMFAQEDIVGSYFYPGRYGIRDKVVSTVSDLDVIKGLSGILGIEMDFSFPKLPDIKQTARVYRTERLLLVENCSNSLRLITGSHYSYLNSQYFGAFENVLHISPVDADRYSIHSGDLVEVFNENGKIVAKVVVDDLCGEGYIFCYKCRELVEGDPNILTSFTPTDSNTGIAIYDTFVKLRRVDEKK